MQRSRLTLGMLLLSAGMAWAALADAPPDEIERNRWLFSHARQDREHFARLLSNARQLNNLSPAARARIQLLDRELQAEPSAAQAKLLRAAQRYADWLSALPAEDRARVEGEADQDKRIAVIKEIRQRQYVEQLPAPARERIDRASDRSRAIAALHQQERRWKQNWGGALNYWDQATSRDRLEKLPPEAREFIKEDLLPRLSKDERQRLQDAEGHWAEYPRTLVELVDDDRVAFRLLMPLQGISRFDDLPVELQKRLRQVKALEFTKKKPSPLEGRWPEFALMVTEVARKKDIPMPKQLGPCYPRDFPNRTREFINQKLMNFNTSVLDKAERERLRATEGAWPAYPRLVLEMARKHKLAIPGVSLPGPAGYWDVYRDPSARGDEASVVSDLVLRVFAFAELTEAERGEIGVRLDDPGVRDRLQQEYVKRHPEEWQKLLDADKAKRAKKSAK